MTRMLRSPVFRLFEICGLLVILAMIAFGGIWLFVPPSTVLQVHSLTIDPNGHVRLVRHVESDVVYAEFRDDVVSATGETCMAFGNAPYERRANGTTYFHLGQERFGHCLARPPIAYTATWWPRLWGFVPLRGITVRAELVDDVVTPPVPGG